MATALQENDRRKRSARRAGKGPTIADVAREAGVSPMTVSRVVNDEPNVVDATREKVREAIARIGYVPNLAARALAGGQQCRLAILHDNPSATWLSEVLVACLEQTSRSDAQLVVERCEDLGATRAIVDHLKAHRIDGVILPPPLCDDTRLLQALKAARIAKVQLASGMPSASADAVGIDDRAAAQAMTGHLIAAGHRRIGFIAGNANQTASLLRREGFEAALAEAGIPPDPALVAQGDFSYRSGLDATDALLDLDARPSAIFASNDDMAAAAIAAAQRRGLDVPADLAVCGFDDTAIATMIWPQLTTVRQPIAEMAKAATLLLIDAVQSRLAKQPRDPRHQCLPFSLVPRDSA